jgi:hypothetical protein
MTILEVESVLIVDLHDRVDFVPAILYPVPDLGAMPPLIIPVIVIYRVEDNFSQQPESSLQVKRFHFFSSLAFTNRRLPDGRITSTILFRVVSARASFIIASLASADSPLVALPFFPPPEPELLLLDFCCLPAERSCRGLSGISTGIIIPFRWGTKIRTWKLRRTKNVRVACYPIPHSLPGSLP